jgi:hypothetical protein
LTAVRNKIDSGGDSRIVNRQQDPANVGAARLTAVRNKIDNGRRSCDPRCAVRKFAALPAPRHPPTERPTKKLLDNGWPKIPDPFFQAQLRAPDLGMLLLLSPILNLVAPTLEGYCQQTANIL